MCPVVSWGNKTDPCAHRQWYWVLCCPFRAIKVHSVSFLTSPVKSIIISSGSDLTKK